MNTEQREQWAEDGSYPPGDAECPACGEYRNREMLDLRAERAALLARLSAVEQELERQQALWTEQSKAIAAVDERRRAAEARVEALEAALREIADVNRHKRTPPDWRLGYELARAVLAPSQPEEKEA